MSSTDSIDKNSLSKLSQEEQLRRENANVKTKSKSMTFASRMVLFLVFPSFIGSLGLIASHLQSKYGKEPTPMNLDRDFVYPFLVTIVLVIVVSIQTGNFSTYQASPLVAWPKVVKKKNIIRKTVVVDDDGNVIEDEDILKSLVQVSEPTKSITAKKDE
jgi:hypothetical protein|eukprot:scaffold164_cov266-Chaetoceros_neogracile.AAC.5